MGVLEFIGSLGESIAWPLATIGALLLFRKEIVRILRSITSFSVSGRRGALRFDLSYKLSEAEVRFPHTDIQPESLPLTSVDDELIRIQPRGAILEQWLEIEELLRRIAESRHIASDGRRISGFPLARVLRESDVIDDDMQFAVERLSLVRNFVVHERRVRWLDEIAERYIDLARSLIVELEPLIDDIDDGPDL